MRFQSSLFPALRLRIFALSSVCAALAFSVPRAQGQKPGISAYFDAYMNATAADLNNARGYGNVGFSPDIMSIPNKPFTATRVYTEGGSSVEVTIARDKVGRVHYESAAPLGGPIGVVIYDPVAHTLSQYSTTRDRGIEDDAVATVTHFGPVGDMVRSAPASGQESMNQESDAAVADLVPAVQASASGVSASELPSPRDLPRQAVNGIAAVGQRTVQKYGDRQQFFMIQEDWLSPDYALNVKQSVWRQNKLDSTVETKDLVAGDPDPDLFRVPGGYSISK